MSHVEVGARGFSGNSKIAVPGVGIRFGLSQQNGGAPDYPRGAYSKDVRLMHSDASWTPPANG